MRRFLTPGWLGLHALAVALCSAFLVFGWWQLSRAQEGNDRSWAYVFEWPIFAVFVIVMWVKMIRDELNDDGVPKPKLPLEPAEPPAKDAIIKLHEEDDEDLAAYNRYLARLNAEPHRRD
ncbi:hypothetical protein [Thermomonospora umbrina]|uniref:hypothetical protein n=1 Tax=Thermomonospora umbrina TaxID=111806 RepID=UPI001FE5F0C9|nr:hypothetical protein [Thermomonospora umbrina]